MSLCRNWDSPNPSPAGECATGWGAHSPAAVEVGESQFLRLEKKLSTLPTLWLYLSTQQKTRYKSSLIVFLDSVRQYMQTFAHISKNQIRHETAFLQFKILLGTESRVNQPICFFKFLPLFLLKKKYKKMLTSKTYIIDPQNAETNFDTVYGIATV